MFNLLKIALTPNLYFYNWSVFSLSKFRGETTPQVYMGEKPDTLECKNFNWGFGAVRLITLGFNKIDIFEYLALYTFNTNIWVVTVPFSSWDEYHLWREGEVINYTYSFSECRRWLQSASPYKANLNMNISHPTPNSKQPQRKVIYSEGIDLC